MSAFLACDWGTTNLRAWVVGDDGRALSRREFAELGVSRLQPGEAAKRFVEQVRPAMQAENLPAILCGMAGSTLGWAVVPYEDAPVGLERLASRLTRVEAPGPAVRIVPGVRSAGVAGAPEVMRGEETQALGWVADDAARRRGRRVLCHPGTHAKWIILEDGEIGRFVTAMTGELYDVLRRHSVLKARERPGRCGRLHARPGERRRGRRPVDAAVHGAHARGGRRPRPAFGGLLSLGPADRVRGRRPRRGCSA